MAPVASHPSGGCARMSPSLQHHTVLGLRTAGASLLLAGRRSARSICLQAAGGGGSDGSATGSTTRPIGCPDLYNMTEAINAQVVPQQTDHAQQGGTMTRLPTEPTQQLVQTVTQEAAPTQIEEPTTQQLGASYYAGLITNDVRVDNAASGGDMLRRSLQLAGGVAVLLAALTASFLAANGLL